MNKTRLEELYKTKILPDLMKKLGIQNPMNAPRISKIVVNVGVKDAVTDSKVLQSIMDSVAKISGQRPVRTLARKSIAGFKLREGMPIGVMVTLRKANMYIFLDKLIRFALPKLRDFRGVPEKLDGRGGYNLGIKEWTIFPEISPESNEKIRGLNVTIHMISGNDQHAFELLKDLGMPFRNIN